MNDTNRQPGAGSEDERAWIDPEEVIGVHESPRGDTHTTIVLRNGYTFEIAARVADVAERINQYLAK